MRDGECDSVLRHGTEGDEGIRTEVANDVGGGCDSLRLFAVIIYDKKSTGCGRFESDYEL